MLDSNISTTRVQLSGDALIFAHFEEIQYRLDILIGDGGFIVLPILVHSGLSNTRCR